MEIEERINETNRQRDIIARELKPYDHVEAVNDTINRFRDELPFVKGELILDVFAELIESAAQSFQRAEQTIDDQFAAARSKTAARWEIKEKARLIECVDDLKTELDKIPLPKHQRSLASHLLNNLIEELDCVLKWTLGVKEGRDMLITRIIHAYFPELWAACIDRIEYKNLFTRIFHADSPELITACLEQNELRKPSKATKDLIRQRRKLRC